MPVVFGTAGSNLVFSIDSVITPAAYPDVPVYPGYADLWTLDASAALGARPIRSLNQRGQRAQLRNFLDFGARVMFLTSLPPEPSPLSDTTLWSSDGTAGGTQPVDAAPFVGIALDWMLGRIGGWTYFGGWQKGSGYELYRMRIADDHPAVYASVDVTEFYHAGLDHYFMTANPGEKALLDNGTLTGWKRTGVGFAAYASNSGAPGVRRSAGSTASPKRNSIRISTRRRRRSARMSSRNSGTRGRRSRRTFSRSKRRTSPPAFAASR